VSCEKADTIALSSLSGTYKGTFQRKIDGSGTVSDVTLTFYGNNWSGTSQYAKYPALCNGTFDISDNTINFQNLCMWTAEFDHSLILSGKFSIRTLGDTIKLSRGGSLYKDVYLLTKQDGTN
jgi:hypothetical protein